MTKPAVSITFSRTHLPYSIAFDGMSGHDQTGIVLLYHVKQAHCGEDIVPLYLGYGNVYTVLRELEDRLKFLSHDRIYYDTIDNPSDPQHLLSSLRQHYKPIFTA